MQEETYYKQIKDLLIDNEIYRKAKDYSKNKNDLFTYYSIGKLLVNAQGGEKRAKYGNNLIKEYSQRLTLELGKSYSATALKYMRQFYMFQKSQPVADQLTWAHYQELLPLKDINKINYYIGITIKEHLSKRALRERIKLKEYERLSNETKLKLIEQKETDISDFVKDPIVIKSNKEYEKISEKKLKSLILENIESFMKELGQSFSYIDNEYKISEGGTNNYIDLLLYNIKYK